MGLFSPIDMGEYEWKMAVSKSIHWGVDGAEGIADLGSEQAHNGDHNEGNESKNDRVLNQTLTFFLGGE